MKKKDFHKFIESKQLEMKINSIQNTIVLLEGYINAINILVENMKEGLTHIEEVKRR